MRGRRWKKSALPDIEEEAQVKNTENVAILPLQTDSQHTNKNCKTNWPQKKDSPHNITTLRNRHILQIILKLIIRHPKTDQKSVSSFFHVWVDFNCLFVGCK